MTVCRPQNRSNVNGAARATARVTEKRKDLVQRNDILAALVETEAQSLTTAPPARTALPVAPAQLELETGDAIDQVAAAKAADPEAWPSLREATAGWDFCSDDSDSEDEDADWVEVKEENMPSEAPAASPEKNLSPQRNPGLSFAELLRLQPPAGVHPPAEGTRMVSKRLVPRRCRREKEVSTEKENEESDDFSGNERNRAHGWSKQHKGSWSTRANRKLTDQVAKRSDQSRLARGE